jgi:AcrR family transcriptional regulator
MSAPTTGRLTYRAGLTREKVLDAALELVDAEGVEALSMRRLGAALGVEAMTLYHYVPNKDALLDGLVDRMLALTRAGIETPYGCGGEPWPVWVRRFAHALRAALLTHPGVLPLVAARPVRSPGTLRSTECWLTVLADAGLPPSRAMDVVDAVSSFTIGHALAVAGRTPAWTELDPGEYPNLAEIATMRAAVDPAARFSSTIEALISGFAL